jgi:nicotinate-nucleotide--dimethylbenzimidazole phosphoribosyltransferase
VNRTETRVIGWDLGGVHVKAALVEEGRVVEAGLARHPRAATDPLQALRCLGGREIAAMTGAMARARIERIPVILDGFICCAAAAVLQRLNPAALDHAVAGHVSAEAAHRRLLAHLGKIPLLDLGMRLGEGSGAALAIGVLTGPASADNLSPHADAVLPSIAAMPAFLFPSPARPRDA